MLEDAREVSFPSETDSNNPVFWQVFRGANQLSVITSAPAPLLSVGPTLQSLAVVGPAAFSNLVDGGRWIEAVLPDGAGRLYGYYHYEPSWICADGTKTAPQIGAARSTDGGRTWKDLGIVLAAPPGNPNCRTPNKYFAGGVGDFSVVLDESKLDVYFLFTSYGPDTAHQGVSVARMLWARRDSPAGHVAVWSDGVWRHPEPTDEGGWEYPTPSPIFRVRGSWHSTRRMVDAFWGPSVHWNTFLKRYVMLLNRTKELEWGQEGVYLSSTATLDDPASWSMPQKLVHGGRWYAQVIGLEPGSGTDRLAGERARFFMGRTSNHEIRFLDQSAAGTGTPSTTR